jgi:hypothetical protein
LSELRSRSAGIKKKCPRCGIIFSKWEALPDREPGPRIRPVPKLPPKKALDRPSLKSSGPALIILKTVCLLGVIAGWHWFLVPAAGLPVPEKAYRDERNAFALVVPSGWQGGRVKNCGGPKNSCEVFVANRQGGAGPVKPTVNVVVMEFHDILPLFSLGSVHFTESNKDQYAREALRGIEGVFKSFHLETASVVSVDALPSLRVAGTGQYIGQSLQNVFFMIPGTSKLFVLSYAGTPENAPDVDGMAQSFRVLETHPSLFRLYGGFWGSLKGDLILGLLIGCSLATIRLLGWSKR